MSVRVVDNTAAIMFNVNSKVGIAFRFMLDAIDIEADPRTPKDKGNLRRDKLKIVNGLHASITWKKNYAIYQENKQFGNYTTPGTGPHFAENAVKRVVAESAMFFKKAGLL